MSAKKIKLYIKEFDECHQESDYADYMSHHTKDKEERDEWEQESEWCLYKLYDIAEKIRHLNPSKYMLEKYTELDYILEF